MGGYSMLKNECLLKLLNFKKCLPIQRKLCPSQNPAHTFLGMPFDTSLTHILQARLQRDALSQC